MSASVAQTGTTTFHDTVESNRVVVVDFYADWCVPCRMVAPIIEKLSDDYNGKVKFARVDVDANQAIAEEFQVANIPTLIIFRNGEPADRIVGDGPPSLYRSRIGKVLDWK